jgi:YD repeat-containing protein
MSEEVTEILDAEAVEDSARDCLLCIAHKPTPQSTGNLQVDPEIDLPSPGMNVNIAYYYNSASKYNGVFGYGRTMTTNLFIKASGSPLVLTLTRGKGNTTEYEETSLGKFKAKSSGNRNTLTLDNIHKTWLETTPDGVITAYPVVSHDQVSNVAYIQDAVGNRHTYKYDANGHLQTLTDAVGRSVSFNYNSDNLLSEIIDWAGRKTAFQYDVKSIPGKPVMTQVTGPTGCQTRYAYDSEARLASITDPNGYTTSYKYDKIGRVIERTIANGSTTKYQYYITSFASSLRFILHNWQYLYLFQAPC